MMDEIFLHNSRGSPNYAAPELLTGNFYNEILLIFCIIDLFYILY